MTIKTATLNGVATIEIARPEKKNALTQAMYTTLAEAVLAARADATVRALLITGQPGVFTAGNDIEDFLRERNTSDDAPVFRFMRALVECDKPVVAAVTGLAIGIGVTMLAHCDLVYVSDEASLTMPFTSIGIVPEFASTILLPALVGHAKAAEWLLLATPFTGADAVEHGLANGVLPAAEVLPHARRMAERFNGLPPGAVRDAKRLIRAPQREAILKTIRTEAEVFGARLGSPEAREAFTAFLQKRKPDYSQFE